MESIVCGERFVCRHRLNVREHRITEGWPSTWEEIRKMKRIHSHFFKAAKQTHKENHLIGFSFLILAFSLNFRLDSTRKMRSIETMKMDWFSRYLLNTSFLWCMAFICGYCDYGTRSNFSNQKIVLWSIVFFSLLFTWIYFASIELLFFPHRDVMPSVSMDATWNLFQFILLFWTFVLLSKRCTRNTEFKNNNMLASWKISVKHQSCYANNTSSSQRYQSHAISCFVLAFRLL